MANVFDQFEQPQEANAFDQFDESAAQKAQTVPDYQEVFKADEVKPWGDVGMEAIGNIPESAVAFRECGASHYESNRHS